MTLPGDCCGAVAPSRVCALLYATVLIGERPAASALVGGALIIVAGLLLVVSGGARSDSTQGRFG